MENETLKYNNFLFENQKKPIKIYKYLLLIIIQISILLIILLINIISNLKLELRNFIKNQTLYNNINIKINETKNYLNKSNYISKSKYNEDIIFYQNNLELFIDNRTEFYINNRKRFLSNFGIVYNDSNVKTIQEKLNWLLIHENPDYKAKIVDKILLHEYSKQILGKDICVPILKIYNKTDEINLNELPDKFVLKCNHGSGMNILCNNKKNINISYIKKKLDIWIKVNYGLINHEYQYINIKKKIFAEKYLCDNINDYKIYCFNEQPKFIRVQKRLPDSLGKVNKYYSLDWNISEIETEISLSSKKHDIVFEKPKYLNLMLEYAKKLSEGFVFVRVDFYELGNEIYLGEMTFTPSNTIFNCKNISQDLYLGNLLNLSKVKNYSN